MQITTTEPSNTAPSAPTLELTPSAITRIAKLLREENNPDAKFRVAVLGGGCSGFQYRFEIDLAPVAANDIVIARDGATVVVDDISLDLIKNSILDYVETLGSAGFELKNPQATARCGCGNSFSV